MKRVLVCLLAIIAIFGLTGCKDNKKVKKEEKKGTATVLKNATAKIGEYDITFDKEAGFHEMKYKYPSTATYGNIDAYTIIDQLDGGNLIYRIAMYYFELGGVDAIAFSAGVGENSIRTRTDIMEGLKVLGVIPDYEANNCRGKEVLVTTSDSKVPCYVVPTDEEIMIARDAYNLANR